MPMFSTKNIRDSETLLYECVDRMVRRMEEEAESGRPVNVLNLTRSLALDVVSTHLFHENYNGTAETGPLLSASAFVDSFVAVGRFFYLPSLIFAWAEWTRGRFFEKRQTVASMEIVQTFVEKISLNAGRETQSYQARLLTAGIKEMEVQPQCKDLIFAGTDSTGMNLAIICRELVLNPAMYVCT